MLHLAMYIYVVTGLICYYISYEFYKSVNGTLRRALIFLFMGIGTAVIVRGIWGLLELEMRVQTNPLVSMFSIGLVFTSVFRFLYVIKKHYRK